MKCAIQSVGRYFSRLTPLSVPYSPLVPMHSYVKTCLGAKEAPRRRCKQQPSMLQEEKMRNDSTALGFRGILVSSH
eukprot:1135936-Amphidinium_carterae.1